ncbi:hypothetical protein ACHAXA_000098 [Cyclostephanos tholiformis]|uniref:Bacterial bifunctional deaminase-reductase C-terminal domain-containing protein n=1 Tax=Cyclostephanos tholiformis TaxID=382380 RepID=A0ABD3R0F3_9STRA
MKRDIDDIDDIDIDVPMEDVTLTLLPCRVVRGTNTLDLKHVLRQLRSRFDVKTLMVEGGAGILSSFMNERYAVGRLADIIPPDDDGIDANHALYNGMVDCVCATIVPMIAGGKRGLSVLGEFDVASPVSPHPGGGADSQSVLADVGRGTDVIGGVTFKDGDFVKLGRDCIFLGRM